MEYQVQGLVLENGEWVSRPIDIYRAMAGVQQQVDTEMEESWTAPRPHPPGLGILTRTVFTSPFFRLILPASIRHKNLNDVVLISEYSVHLKEIRDYGHLHHVATKSDFDGRILAACVFGIPRKVHVSDVEKSPLLKKAVVYQGRRSVSGEAEESLMPPEVIVLTLSSRTLMFLWARHDRAGVIKFCQRTARLPGATRLDQPGTFLAIDPRGRAIAVAAPQDRFVLYKTKTMDKWREDVPNQLPFEDERIVRITGRIMHMEFLSSSGDSDDSHVVLLLVLVHNGRTKLTCFDWDYHYDLSTAAPRVERLTVSAAHSNPSLLIPLARNSDFLLVHDNHISIHKNILSGTADAGSAEIPARILAPLRPGDSRGTPQWVQWDRAPRNPGFSKESFYLAREDGVVLYLEVESSGLLGMDDAGGWPYPIDTAFACLNVDNSKYSQLFPDVLIAGGAGSEGHLCKVGAWPTEYSYAPFPGDNTFAFLESIPNWAPLSDLTVTELPYLSDLHERDRCAVLVANGKTPHGELTELRQGLHAIVDDSFDFHSGVTGLWIMDHGSTTVELDRKETAQHYATFIFTLPPQTFVIRVQRTQLEGQGPQSNVWRLHNNNLWEKMELPDEDGAGAGVVQDHTTLSACAWTDEYAIQITDQVARTLHRPTLATVDSITFDVRLSKAATKTNFPFVAVSFYDMLHSYHVELISVSHNGQFGRNPQHRIRHQLECDPTCIELFELANAPYIFVGTRDTRICLFKVLESGSLQKVYDQVLEQTPSASLTMVCESAKLLNSEQRLVLVCGMRNGFLLSLDLDIVNHPYQVKRSQLVKMGQTAAHIYSCSTDVSAAFVACGSDLCRIRLTTRNKYLAGMSVVVDIDSVWLTDRRAPAYAQTTIAAFDQLPMKIEDNSLGRNLGGFIFSVSGNRMVFAQLDYDVRWSLAEGVPQSPEAPKVVPRKLMTGATPTRQIYMPFIKQMLVSFIEPKEERAPPHGYRITHSSVKLIAPYDSETDEETEIKQEDGTEAHDSSKKLVTAEFTLKHNERVYAITEWTYVDERSHKYQFIILGTGVKEGATKETGRRIFLQMRKSGGLKQSKESTFDQPVRCLAVYDNTRIISVVGKTLTLDEYEPSAGRWFKRGKQELSSIAVHVTVQAPFVYVSTGKDSHICYEVTKLDNIRQTGITFQQVFTDDRARPSAHHVVLTLPNSAIQQPPPESLPSSSQNAQAQQSTNIVLLSTKTGSIAGLYHPPSTSYKSSTATLFEANLPRSIIRLQRGDIRPPWRRPLTSPTPQQQQQPHTTSTITTTIPTGILTDDLIGASSDGTIYNLALLSLPALNLLRFLQNLILLKKARDPATQFTPPPWHTADVNALLNQGTSGVQNERIRARDVDPEIEQRGHAAPRMRHVDGDLLEAFFVGEARGVVELIAGGDVMGDVERRFWELVEGVGLWGVGGGGGGGGGDADADADAEEVRMRSVEKWIGEVVMPVL